ncbi:MAG: hypothetical protein QF524_05565, partial [Planctomycetota bacterium]|nr:hypothetical protein [Planctomycetota bacterium]
QLCHQAQANSLQNQDSHPHSNPLELHAACTLLEIDSPLSRLRGQVHPNPQGGPPILATYHPAYLLRNPSAKKDCWADIQIGMVHLGLPIQN